MLDDRGLDLMFRAARSHNGWLPQPVADDELRLLWDLMRMAPTSANCSPARLVFVRSSAAKERLKPALSAGNVEKTMAAPATVIVGYDLAFYELLPRLFPHEPGAMTWFTGSAAMIEATAFRNGTLQGAYLIMAARALGLDCGPMSGFDNGKVDAAFFPGGTIRSNFLCNLGHGDPAKVMARSPRLDFGDACQIV